MNHLLKYNLKIYTGHNDKAPFIEWLESIDKVSRYRIKERLNRIALGNLGDYRAISNEILELRCSFSSGYRIYLTKISKDELLLLNAGNKRTQKSDIKKATTYLKDYLLR